MNYGVPKKCLTGHNHFISDVVMSSDGQFALSGSWDKTLRLWDLNAGITTRQFVGHTKDVLSVAFSADNRQIVSGSRDNTIKLWNTLGQCKYTISDECHSEWVSCVRFSPNTQNPIIVSCGWDKAVKVWNLTNCKLKTNHIGHTGYLNTVTLSPDGSLCASGGKDGKATPATSTPSPSPPTAPCAPAAARTARPCSGTSTTGSISTRWRTPTSSALWSSLPTGTGCVPPRAPASRRGTWRARTRWRSCAPRWPAARAGSRPSAPRSPGQLTVRRSSPGTATTSSACGRSAWPPARSLYHQQFAKINVLL